MAIAELAYALSPIDLIPDSIPIFGLPDDLFLIPLAVALTVKLTPVHLWQARLAEAQAGVDKLPHLVSGAVAIVALRLLMLGGFGWWLWTVLASSGSTT